MDWAGWALFGLVATAALDRGDDRRPAGRAAPGSTCPWCWARSSPRTPTGPGSPGSSSTSASARVSPSATPPTFALLHRATWWLGALLGLLHVGVALTVLLPLLAGVHPRMASQPGRPGQHGGAGAARGCSPSTTASRHRWSRLSSTSSTGPSSACSCRPVTRAGCSPSAAQRRAICATGVATDQRLRAAGGHPHRRPGRARRRDRLDVRAPLRRRPLFGRLVGGPDGGHVPGRPGRAGHGRRAALPAAHRHPGDHLGGRRRRLHPHRGMVAEVGGRLLPATLLVRRLSAERRPVDAVVEFDPRLGARHRRPRGPSTAAGARVCSGARSRSSLDSTPAARPSSRAGPPGHGQPGPSAHPRAGGGRTANR